jgi:hypothetical protein
LGLHTLALDGRWRLARLKSCLGEKMKLLTAVLLGAALIASSPVVAQGNYNRSDSSNMHRQDARAAVRSQQVSHRVVRPRATYRRTYKTNQEERQQTQDLNSQYRGVSSSDMH